MEFAALSSKSGWFGAVATQPDPPFAYATNATCPRGSGRTSWRVSVLGFLHDCRDVELVAGTREDAESKALEDVTQEINVAEAAEPVL